MLPYKSVYWKNSDVATELIAHGPTTSFRQMYAPAWSGFYGPNALPRLAVQEHLAGKSGSG